MAAEIRRELVGRLSAAGLSTRTIAPTVGVSQQAVSKSLNRDVTTKLSPAPAPAETIAPAVGVSFQQVAKDNAQVSPEATPAPVPAETINPDTGEIVYDHPEPTRPTNPHERPHRRGEPKDCRSRRASGESP